MKAARALLSALLSLAFALPAMAEEKHAYVPETDPKVLARLEQWQDWKFGFLMHWGPYSQWGIVESWSLCSEDVDWCRRPKGVAYADYVRQYEQLPTTFNPVKFDPDAWARAAKQAGMQYVVFTTKHHDGFSMFDTKQTDYRITAPDVPFHRDPRANITKAIFDAFRAQDFGIGAYFSKPDWHHDDYWAPEWATPDRNTNYDTRKHPDRWKRFVDFTHAQINELTSEYGRLDILWLDGGWVDSRPNPNAKPISGEVPWPQDIDMPGLVSIARRNQPGLIVVNRAVGGPYENYRTPEQHIPETELPYPWETCMTMGESWSYVPNDKYKPSRELVHKLVDVVAKGGNFLLNVGPAPDGTLPPTALERMRDIGAWMQVNGEAIHASRAIAPYREGKLRFTRLRDGTVYAIYLADDQEQQPPATILLKGLAPAEGAELRVLGADAPLTWRRTDAGSVIEIPAAVRRQVKGAYAWTIRIAAIRN